MNQPQTGPECYLCAERPIERCRHCSVPFCQRCAQSHDGDECGYRQSRVKPYIDAVMFDPLSQMKEDYFVPTEELEFLPITPLSPAIQEDIELFKRRIQEVFASMGMPKEYLGYTPGSIVAEDRRFMDAVREEQKKQWGTR